MSGPRQESGSRESHNRDTAFPRRVLRVLLGAGLTLAVFSLGRFTAPRHRGDGAELPRAIASAPKPAEVAVPPRAEAVNSGEATGRATWDTRWRTRVDAPGTPQRDEALVALFEERGRFDAAGALALAATESNWILREKFRTAVLRGWAAQAPDSAADWVEANLSEAQRPIAIEAVIQGAANSPEAAARFVGRLILKNPQNTYGHGHTLIRALAERGEFAAAAKFAASQDLPGPAPSEWTTNAFFSWAQHQPKLAAQAALALTDPDSRKTALTGVFSGWAPGEPAGLAEFALQLPTGPDRTTALGESLRHWVMQDPAAASAWLNRLESSAEIDAGAAAIATVQPLIIHRPEVAIGWAESIVDPTLRRQTLDAVIDSWSLIDPPAAQRYLSLHPRPAEHTAAK